MNFSRKCWKWLNVNILPGWFIDGAGLFSLLLTVVPLGRLNVCIFSTMTKVEGDEGVLSGWIKVVPPPLDEGVICNFDLSNDASPVSNFPCPLLPKFIRAVHSRLGLNLSINWVFVPDTVKFRFFNSDFNSFTGKERKKEWLNSYNKKTNTLVTRLFSKKNVTKSLIFWEKVTSWAKCKNTRFRRKFAQNDLFFRKNPVLAKLLDYFLSWCYRY